MAIVPIGAYVPPQLRISDDQYLGMSEIASKALNKFLDTNLCDIAGKFEAGYRKLNLLPLAGLVMAGRRFSGCSPNLPNDLRKKKPDPPFTGGQCFTQYTVNYEIYRNGALVEAGPATFTGRIDGFGIVPVPQTTQEYVEIRYSTTPTTQNNTQLGGAYGQSGTLSYNIVSIVRTDGQPDDCGDVDTGEPVYPPPIDLPPQPWPDPGDTIFNSTSVDVDIDVGGINVQVSVDIGDITFDVAGLKVEIGEVKLQISPDFRINFDTGGNDKRDIDELKNDINGIGQDIDEIKQDLEQEYSGVISWTDCDGNTFSEGYSGPGLNGVIAAISAQNSVNNQGDLTVCPVDDGNGTDIPETLLHRQTYAIETETGNVYEVPAGAKIINVVIESGDVEEYLYKGIGEPNYQGRFGLFFWGFGQTNDIKWSEPKHIYFLKTQFEIPVDVPGQRFYRISSQPGFTIASYDSGKR